MNLFFVVPCIIVKIIFYLIAFLENKHWPIFLVVVIAFVFCFPFFFAASAFSVVC